MTDPKSVRDAFRRIHGHDAERLFRAPGRVNLIGEHTDYNDGFVLPVAIDRDTICAVKAKDNGKIRVHSLNLNETHTIDPRSVYEPDANGKSGWTSYIDGVARVLIDRGVNVGGCDMLVASDVPDGAGLSSSAALEISVGLALLGANVGLSPVELALAAQQAEHEYVGTMCGIMDQYVSVLGQKDHALLIDCRTLQSQQISMTNSNAKQNPVLVVCDTRVKHSLASSEYNKRRSECERATELFQEYLPNIRALRDVSVQEFEDFSPAIEKREDAELLLRRSRHVITENARTLEVTAALKEGDWETMGQLMYQSHTSLRDDYEVSCVELDLLVEISKSFSGTIGARMTGGGFGGSTVNFINSDRVDEFVSLITREYTRKVGSEPGVFVTHASAGAEEIDN
jgi:galactokinase